MRATLVRLFGAFLCTATLMASADAAVPADAPAGTTGMCNDGSYSASAGKRGACRGHKGVKEWYASDATAATPGGPKATSTATTPPVSTTTVATPTPTTTSTVPSAMPAPARTTSTATPTKATGPAAQPAAGGGPGLVWVNTSTKVYHCTGTRWYGKSKQGSYMSEADAKGQGARPSHGKACAA